MSLIYIWLIAYAAPALVAGAIVKLLPPSKTRPNKRNAIIMHAALAVSVLLSQYFIYANSLVFPWHPNSFSLLVYIVSVAIAMSLLGWMGFWYGLSALLQQMAMLSIAFLLFPFVGAHWRLVVRLCQPTSNADSYCNSSCLRAQGFVAYSHATALRGKKVDYRR